MGAIRAVQTNHDELVGAIRAVQTNLSARLDGLDARLDGLETRLMAK
jgi:hypothetical protein